jgi:transcriptional regulator with XRE-family HTH domain
MITGEQAKAARKLLGWTPAQLSANASVPEGTITKLELGVNGVSLQRLAAIRRALEAAGIIFLADGPDVRLRKGPRRSDVIPLRHVQREQ